MRAIAVVSVVLFHAFSSVLSGGFVGVDVFFVISGFLISTIIFKQLAENRFSFRQFYTKRVNRIFPALILVLIVSYLFGFFFLFTNEFQELGKHIFGGAGFFSNFVLWKEDGYFNASSELKPLLHLWSLSVEEQFYIFWPFLLFVSSKKRFNSILIVVFFLLFSFVLNIVRINHHAVSTFYLLPTRLWELLLGALLAYQTLYSGKYLTAFGFKFDKSAYINTKAFLGFGIIIFSAIFFQSADVFPGYRALFPTVGCLLIISAGPDAWFNKKVLSQSIVVWLGLISYPLYLWHWPILSFLRVANSGQLPNKEVRIMAVLISLILAWLTYYFLERPIRAKNDSRKLAISFFTILIGIGLLGFFTYKNPPARNSYAIKSLENKYKMSAPKSTVGKDEGCPIKKFVEMSVYCVASNMKQFPTVALVGDSHANAMYFGLSKFYTGINENLINLGMGGCLPFWDLESSQIGTQDICIKSMNPILDYIIDTPSIKSVILSSRGPLYISGKGFADSNSAPEEINHNRYLKYLKDESIHDYTAVYRKAMSQTLKKLVNAGKEVVFVLDVPELGFSPSICLDPRPLSFGRSKKYPCAIQKEDYSRRNKEYISTVTETLKSFPTVKVFDPSKYLCDQIECKVIDNNSVLYSDDDHLSSVGSEFVALKYFEEFHKF